MKATCPNDPTHDQFLTSCITCAVTPEGEFLEVTEQSLQISHKPDPGNTWLWSQYLGDFMMANPLPPPITTVRSAWLRSLTPGTKVRWCSNILGHFTCRKSIIKDIQEGKIHMIGNVTIPISDGVTVTKAGCIWWLEPLDSRDTYVGVSAQLLEEWLRTIRSAFDLTENERVEELLNDVMTDIEKVINNAKSQ